MCKHEYQKKSGIEHRDRCTIESYFNLWKSFNTDENEITHPLQLPQDKNNRCIFHSIDLKWKTKENFNEWFNKIIEIVTGLNDEEFDKLFQSEYTEFDLRECTFLGGLSHLNDINVIQLIDLNFYTDTYINISSSTFHDKVSINRSSLEKIDLDLKGCTFHQTLQIHESKFKSISLDHSIFNEGLMLSDSLFGGIFEACALEVHSICTIMSNDFEDIVYFNEAAFYSNSIVLDDNIFINRVDFSNCLFEGDLNITKCQFKHEVQFHDTIFQAPLLLHQNIYHNVVAFRASNSEYKLFLDFVHFHVEKSELKGSIVFENVNFHNILEHHRNELTNLSRDNKVTIGKGCLKYRLQTEIKILYFDKNKQVLIIELAHSFANYFIKSKGYNLGIDIIDRDEEKIQFIYFSDENISKEEFLENMNDNEIEFMDLLFLSPDNVEITPTNKTSLTSIIDSYASLISLCWKISARISAGSWNRTDTKTLFSTINLTKSPILNINSLHNLIIEKFSIPKIVQHFTIHKTKELNINNPLYYKSKVQNADKIINNNFPKHEIHIDLAGLLQLDDLKKKKKKKIKKHLSSLDYDNLSKIDWMDTFYELKNIIGENMTSEKSKTLNDYFINNDLAYQNQNNSDQFSFLSFAEEDAESAIELYNLLQQNGINSWFSRVHLDTSDSIIGVVNDAIVKSRYGIVLMSNHTLESKDHFPILELDALVDQKLYRNLKLMIIYHNITHEEILDHYPLLANTFAVNSKDGMKNTVAKIVSKINTLENDK